VAKIVVFQAQNGRNGRPLLALMEAFLSSGALVMTDTMLAAHGGLKNRLERCQRMSSLIGKSGALLFASAKRKETSLYSTKKG
jgi:hypothetical protein